MQGSSDKEKKVALISGGGGGFGGVVARAFLEDGYRIVLTDIDSRRLEKTAASLSGEIVSFASDLSREADVRKLFDGAVTRFGRIDVMFLGHGVVSGRTPIQETTLEEWNFVIQTNLTGVFLCMKEAVSVMIKQKFGRIICVTTGDPARKLVAPYVASKLGIEGLVASVATETRECNVGAYAVSPGGYANTRFHDNSYELLHFKNYIPDDQLRKMVKPVKPEVIVPFCRFAAADSDLSMSGKVVNALEWNEQHGMGKNTWYV